MRTTNRVGRKEMNKITVIPLPVVVTTKAAKLEVRVGITTETSYISQIIPVRLKVMLYQMKDCIIKDIILIVMAPVIII